MAPLEATVLFRYGAAEPPAAAETARRQPTPGCCTQPRGLHACADGSLLVADFARNCVLRFQPRQAVGKVVAGENCKALPTVDPLKDIDRPLGAPDGEGFLLKQPGDVVEDSQGSVLVLDTDAARVQRFGSGAATTLVPPNDFMNQKSVHAPEAIKNPRGLCFADGALIVCDTWSHRVLKYQGSSEPQLLAGTPNSAGVSSTKLCFPSAAVIGLNGALFVADTNNHRIQRFEPGQLDGITVAGSGGKAGSELCSLNMPTGICIDGNGNLYVADRANARVLRFPPNSKEGDSGEVIAGKDLVERPWGLCIGKDGTLFVSDERRGVVLQLEIPTTADVPKAALPRDQDSLGLD